MTVRNPQSDDDLSEATGAIRQEYARRRQHPSGSTGRAMFESRLRCYKNAFQDAGLLPLRGRRILDLGCGNGKWLDVCCQRWQAEPHNCFGVDLLPEGIEAWYQTHPASGITLRCQPAHEIDFDDASFDIVHQSMMLSSVRNEDLRLRTAEQMWRVLRPGGCICSYDFWINPLNKATVGIRLRELRRLFPLAQIIFHKTITLVPAVCRVINKLNEQLSLAAEKLRFMNTHQLVILAKQ